MSQPLVLCCYASGAGPPQPSGSTPLHPASAQSLLSRLGQESHMAASASKDTVFNCPLWARHCPSCPSYEPRVQGRRWGDGGGSPWLAITLLRSRQCPAALSPVGPTSAPTLPLPRSLSRPGSQWDPAFPCPSWLLCRQFQGPTPLRGEHRDKQGGVLKPLTGPTLTSAHSLGGGVAPLLPIRSVWSLRAG